MKIFVNLEAFEWKKYIVVGVCLIDIFVLIAYAAFSGVMADELLEAIMESINVENKESGRTIIIAITVTFCVVSVFYEFVGIIGAMLENFTIIIIYLVGALLELAIRLVYSIYEAEFWGLLLWEVITWIVVIVYAVDLYRRRHN